jgi:hypothetical protein
MGLAPSQAWGQANTHTGLQGYQLEGPHMAGQFN